MAATWPIFQTKLTVYLTKKKGKQKETARKIALEYHKAVRTAFPTTIKGATPLSGNFKLIQKGFETSFDLAFNSKKAPTPATWTPAALGIVAYWTGLAFNPVVPPPGYVPGVSNLVVFPGVPPAPLIWRAMKAKKERDVAKGLVRAFKTHLKTVSGVFIGNPIGSPSPVPFPWVGVG